MTNKTNELERIVEEINNWDTEDIYALRYSIRDFHAEIKRLNDEEQLDWDPQPSVDFSSLPSAPLSDDVDTIELWACDKRGMCLVGEHLDEIVSLEEWCNDRK